MIARGSAWRRFRHGRWRVRERQMSRIDEVLEKSIHASLDAVRFRRPPKNRRHCRAERLAKGQAAQWRRNQGCTEKQSGDWRRMVCGAPLAVRCTACAPFESQLRSSSSSGREEAFLHRAAVEHVEHVRVGRAASVSVVAHEVVDAHARSAGRLRGGRRWSPAVAAGRVRLQRAILLGRVVGRRGGPRRGGRLRVWGGGGTAGIVAVGALRRGLARRLCGVVWLRGWRGGVGCRRGGCTRRLG